MATAKKQTPKTTSTTQAEIAELKLNATTLAKEGAYATVGLTDLTVAFVRTLPTKVEQWRSDLPPKVEQWRTDLPQVVKRIGEDPPRDQLLGLRKRATGEFTSLADRGRTIVEALQRNAKPGDAVEQMRKAREQMRAVTGDLRKAMLASRGAVTGAADQARDTLRAASRASQRRQYEEMTVEELQDLAAQRDIAGRSELTKDELVKALLKA